METKIITVCGKNYKAVPEFDTLTPCIGCSFIMDDTICNTATLLYSCGGNGVIFQELTETLVQTKPQVQLQLELDLTQAILPVFFTVKGLKVQSLDTALKNQSDAYTISVKDLPQETLEVLAEELKREFLRRNTNVK